MSASAEQQLRREAVAGRRLRVLNIVGSANPETGGPIEVLVRLAEAAGASGYDGSEVLTLDMDSAPFVNKSPLTVHAMGPDRSGWRRWLPWARYGVSAKFVRWLREHASRYDVLVLNGLWNFTTMGTLLAMRGRRMPTLVYPHGMLDPWFTRTYPLKTIAKRLFWFLADGRLVNSADAVLFTCEEERTQARNTFRPYHPRERVVAFGTADAPPADPAQLRAFRALVPALGDRRYLLYLSRIHEKKGCDLLIDAFAAVAASHPELDLVMAGPDSGGLKARLVEQAVRLGIAGRIHWPGMVSGDAKWGAFRGAEAFVLPSHQENFGIVVAEAMACRTPVLISDKVNIWREVEASGGGLVEPDTLAGAGRLLARFLDLDAKARQDMAAAARSGYEAHFGIAGASADLAAVLQDVTAGQVR